jgi:class 3 adenylate cyclase
VDVVHSCGKCGFENPEGARFCNQCGSPLTGEPVRHAERRQITVLFSDLSGFTAMSEHLDPEDVQGVMGEIFTAATRIIERFGGRVDKLLGDAVMAVFGDPVAHEDDAERAVRSALEIHAAVDELSPSIEPRIGRPLAMHTGVNTGVVVTSSGAFDTADTGPLGDTINLAARLEDLSEQGEILLGPETAGLVGSVFELEDYGSHALKGKSGPIAVSKVAGLKQSRAGRARKQAAFVGRHEELGVLLAAVEKVQDREGSVIGLRAEAGAGKTRLLAEFRERVRDRVQWLEGRAYAYGENIPFAPLVDLISNAVGINEDDTHDSIAAKLHEGMADLVGDLDRVLDPFHRLFGIPLREGAALDKDSFQDRLLESLVAVVGGLCERAPTVLVLQDLHWADPSTISIFSGLVESVAAPVVVVANYRPAFEGSLPGLREIELQSLSPRQSAVLVASLLDGGEPPGELVDFVVERTDGNPFYLEEIINSLVETNTLRRVDGEWRIEGSLESADVPSSVRGVIAARIDRLAGDRRRVLREASVVGRDFLYEVIRRVASSDDDLDPSLSDLESADLIREREQQADLEYFFKHALTQDVAYEGLLKPERVELHGRAAAAIEEQFAGRLEEVTETLAFHYKQAGNLDKAVHYLRAAGRKAMDRYALIEAQAHYEAAYELLTNAEPSPDIDRATLETILDWAILFYYRARLLELDDLLEMHRGAIDRLDDDTLRMWWLIWRGHAAGFKLDQANNMEFLDAAVEIAQRTGDEPGLVYARTWQIWGHFITGRPEAAIEVAEEIDDWVVANRYDDPYPYLKSRGTLAYVLASTGDGDRVRQIGKELIEFGGEVGNNRCIAFGHQGLAFLDTLWLSLSAAIAAGREAHDIAKDPIYSDTANLSVAAAATLAADTDVAIETVAELRRAMQSGVELPAPLFVSISEGVVRMSEGELTAGIEQLFAARDEAQQASRMWEHLFAEFFIGAIFARMVTGEATRDLKRLARNPGFLRYVRRAKKEAAPRLRAALDEAHELGFAGVAPMIECELAKLLIHNGDKSEARQLLNSALAAVGGDETSEGTERVRELIASL